MIQIRRSYISYVYVVLFLFILGSSMNLYSNDLMLYLTISFWIFILLIALIRRIAYRE